MLITVSLLHNDSSLPKLLEKKYNLHYNSLRVCFLLWGVATEYSVGYRVELAKTYALLSVFLPPYKRDIKCQKYDCLCK